jgi:hypothetical protein
MWTRELAGWHWKLWVWKVESRKRVVIEQNVEETSILDYWTKRNGFFL